jgi:hypothetical protein
VLRRVVQTHATDGQAEMLAQVTVGHGQDCRAPGTTEIERDAIRFLVAERRQNPLSKRHGHGVWHYFKLQCHHS